MNDSQPVIRDFRLSAVRSFVDRAAFLGAGDGYKPTTDLILQETWFDRKVWIAVAANPA